MRGGEKNMNLKFTPIFFPHHQLFSRLYWLPIINYDNYSLSSFLLPSWIFFVISTDERILRNDLNDFCEVYFVEWWNDFATFSFNIVKSHRTVCGQKPYIVTFLFTEITLRWLCKFKNISSSLTQKVFRRDRTLSLPTCTD